MDSNNMTTDQWTDQMHAQAIEALQHAGTYVLAVVTEEGIKILDGSPGESGTCSHSQLCLYSMLEGWAKTHRKIIKKQMLDVEA